MTSPDPTADPEIAAMSSIATTLTALDDAARSRVLRWAADRFDIRIAHQKKAEGAESTTHRNSPPSDDVPLGEVTFASIADLFAEANPTTGPLKVLVAGYWLQIVKKQESFSSYEVNKELNHLGHMVTSINKVFDSLKDQKPSLAIQVGKSGTGAHARKKHKLTTAGVAKVNEMLANQKKD